MKLFTFFFFVATLQISAKGYSQNVNITASDITLKKAFRQIEQQTGYSFFVNNELLKKAGPVTLSLKNATIDEALKACLLGQPFTYSIINKTVILKAKEKPNGSPSKSLLPNIQISGVVTDSATGEPLPGVTIVVRGSNTGALTDAKGEFSLEVEDTAVLVVSYLGYTSKVIPVNGRTFFNITLAASATELNQLVVVGYGEQKKKNLVESVSTISSKELNLAPTANVGNMLAGKATGVVITQRNGYPFSDAPDILIRGVATLSKGNAHPLIIVDGVKRNMWHLNPNNIESVSILKDAAATAIYGIEGANGVILVTTKRGHKGPAKFSINLSAGLQQMVNTPKFIGSYRYAKLYNQAQISDGVDPANVRFPEEAIRAFKYHTYPLIYPDMDWVDYLMKPYAFQTRNSISVSGGTDYVKYYISAGYLFQDGLFKIFETKFNNNPSYSKYNFRSNLDIDFTPSTRISLTAYGRNGTHVRIGDIDHEWGNVVHGAPFAGAGLHYVPGAPAYYGKVLVTGNSQTNAYYIPGDKHDPLKPYYSEGVNIYTRSTINIDLSLRQKLDFLTKGLAFQFKASYNTWYEKGKNGDEGEPEFQAFFKTDVDPNAPGDSTIVFKQLYRSNPYLFDESYGESRRWYMEARFSYNRHFGRHGVSGLVLYNQRREYYPTAPGEDYEGLPRGLVGMVGRVKYNYDSRYLLEASMGYNGSENFAKGRRFGVFPAVAGAWIITNESFMKNVTFLDFLKLRASYGIVGSDQGQGRFLYLPSTFYVDGRSTQDYSFGYDISQRYRGAQEGKIGNPEVTWETASKQNYAINMEFLDHRLKLDFAYFYEDRTNILTTLNTVPAYVAAVLPVVNIGEVKNHGYEAKIEWDQDVGQDFSYGIEAHVTFARNEIIEMDEVHRTEPYLYKTGHPVGQPFGYIFDRFYEQSDFDADGNLLGKFPQPTYLPKPGDLKYKDLNGDGYVNSDDERAIGYPNYPEYTFGSNISLRYKNFSLITIWQGAAHVTRMFAGAPFRVAFGLAGRGGYGVFRWQADGAWTPEKGQNATYPRLSTTSVTRRNEMDSDFWLHNSSYVRLKNAQLAYNLPNGFVNKLGLGNVRFYLSGYNLLTFSELSKYSLDPERSATYDGTIYPIQKVYNFGIDIDF